MKVRLALVTWLVALGVIGVCAAQELYWRQFGTRWHLPLGLLAAIVVVGAVIGGAVLVSTKSVVRAVTLGVLTVVLPALEVSLLFPHLLYE